MNDRTPNDTQVSSSLPGLTHHITTHNEDGKAIIYSSAPAVWNSFLNNAMAFNVVYTNASPAQLSTNADIDAYTSLMANGGPGLTLDQGTVCRIVDFSPGVEPIMHRTQSLDFGVVLEGEVELGLDGGESESRVLKRGDVCIQRGTNHSWKNVTPENGWARMLFVLQAAQEINIGDKKLGEDVGNAGEEAAGLLKQK